MSDKASGLSLFASTILFVFPVALMLSPWSAGLVALLAGGWALVALRRPAGASPGGGLPVGFAAWLWALLAFGGHWLLDAGRG
ncbi:hypothetical protein, partial [Alloalcanivorax gelatiniphagus]|uniref:hypothetical protein n=1 Tax=Alloalcanivorax gelatiniphagus TaxID=1194167 RepID=UPI00361DC813